MERCRGQISIKGILVPVDWDEKGNAIRLAIMTPNEEEYIVEENRNGRELLDLMRQEVEVRGILREEAGHKIIMVETYKQMK